MRLLMTARRADLKEFRASHVCRPFERKTLAAEGIEFNIVSYQSGFNNAVESIRT